MEGETEMLPYLVEVFLTHRRNGGMTNHGIKYPPVTLEKLANDIGMTLDHSVYGVNQPAHYDLIETREDENGNFHVIFSVSESLFKSIKSHAVDLRMHNCELYFQRSDSYRTEIWDEM